MTYQVAEDATGDGPEIQIEVDGLTDSEQAFGPVQSAELQNSNAMTACSAISPWSLWLAGPALLLLGLRRRRD
jgi:hypothetical protein